MLFLTPPAEHSTGLGKSYNDKSAAIQETLKTQTLRREFPYSTMLA